MNNILGFVTSDYIKPDPVKSIDVNERKYQRATLNPIRDNAISFNEFYHKYYLSSEGKDNYEFKHSVTGYTSNKLHDSFDAKAVAHRMSKTICGQNKLFFEWSMAAKLGSCVHREIEKYLNTYHLKKTDERGQFVESAEPDVPEADFQVEIYHSDLTPPREVYARFKDSILPDDYISKDFQYAYVDRVTKIFENFKRMYNLLYKHLELIVCEYIIFDMKYFADSPIAGSIDALFWTNKEKREVLVVDWKTNKTHNYDQKFAVKNSISPFAGQKITSVEKYYCQLHAYSTILNQNYNVEIHDAHIVHITSASYALYGATNYKTCPCKSIRQFKEE